MSNKDLVFNNIIGLNPTGKIDFNGTYKMVGNNNIVKNPSNISKHNLQKTQKNEVVCSSIEKFNNYKKPDNNLNYIYLLILFFFIFLIILYLYKKKY